MKTNKVAMSHGSIGQTRQHPIRPLLSRSGFAEAGSLNVEAWKRESVADEDIRHKEKRNMNDEDYKVTEHKHEPKRLTMTARKCDILALIARMNMRLAGRGHLELRGDQLFNMCSRCNEPIAITDCTFVPEDMDVRQ
jgi:hypothetical protein